jgi:hypothetical protein
MVGILLAAVIAALTFAASIELELSVGLAIVIALVALVASVPTVGTRFGAGDL